jgi:hypothetical protein
LEKAEKNSRHTLQKFAMREQKNKVIAEGDVS